MATNYRVKIGEIGLVTFICRLDIQCGFEYRNSDFKIFTVDDLLTSCESLVRFGSVTSKLKRLKGVHPLVDQQLATFAWWRHC